MAGLVARPLEAVHALFQQSGGSEPGDWGVRVAFEAALADPAVLAQVPYLNADTIDRIPQGGLVRYRGMVQDTLDPEYYLGALRRPDGSWATTKFSDATLAAPPAEADMKVWDRKPLYCTAVPGEAAWVVALNPGEQDCAAIRPATPPPGEPAHTSKRAREEPDSEAEDMAVEPGFSAAGFSGHNSAGAVQQLATTAGAAAAARKQARQQAADAAASAGNGAADVPEAEEAAGEDGLPPPQQGDCIVFVYDEADSLKLNEVVEFVGVLSRAPELAAGPVIGGDAGFGTHMSELYAEESAAWPPTSQVPRVHAILATRQASTLPAAAAAAASQPSQVPELRATALQLLAAPLGGDALAAEYLLLQLLSRVHTRKEKALGVLSLNLTGCPAPLPASGAASASASTPAAATAAAGATAGRRADSATGPAPPMSSLGAAVETAVAALAARVYALPVSVPLLNARSLRPNRDYRSNRLVGGALQLPRSCQLLLDETTMAAGTLAPTGVANLQAIKRLIEDMQVDYDFEYYQLPQPADVATTLLSAGRSMFKEIVDVTLLLAPAAPFADAAAVAAAADAADLAPVRAYIAVAQAADFKIDDQAATFVEAQLAQHMAADRAADVKTFHTWLTVARLLALSHGETGLAPQRWSDMRSLEARREARLRVVRA